MKEQPLAKVPTSKQEEKQKVLHTSYSQFFTLKNNEKKN